MSPQYEQLLKQYADDLAKDMVVNQLNITDVCFDHPNKRQRWFDRLNQCKCAIYDNKELLDDKIKDSLTTQRIDLTKKVDLSQRAKSVSIDPDVISIQKSISDLERIKEFLEGAIKMVSEMQWDIKNIIENNKLNQL